MKPVHSDATEGLILVRVELLVQHGELRRRGLRTEFDQHFTRDYEVPVDDRRF